MKENRLDYMDVAKGIGIIAIILGHSSIMFERYVFPFHVPLFFLISGFFLSFRKPIAEYTKNKARQLLVPYCVTAMCVTIEKTVLNTVRGGNWASELLKSFLSAIYGSGSSSNKILFGIEPIGAIWFLLALFTALICIRVINSGRNSNILILIALIAVSILTTKIVWLPWSVQAGITASGYVLVGVYCKGIIRFDNIWIALIGLLVYIAEVITDTRVSVASNRYGVYGFAAIGAVVICYSIVYICKLIGKIGPVKKVLSFLGRYTLPILCFHLVEITVFPWGHFNGFTNLILLVCFPVLCVLVFKRFQIYKWIFR